MRSLTFALILVVALSACAGVGGTAESSQDRNPDGFPAKPEEVSDPAEIQSTMAAFDDHLARFGQRVRSCDHVVTIQIVKDSQVYWRGLAAYGAHCTLANGEDVAMCYEEAVGRFALVARSFAIEQAWIEAFTLRTCVELS